MGNVRVNSLCGISHSTLALICASVIFACGVSMFYVAHTAQAIGEASTKFQIYVPPNNVSGRDVSLIVTAMSDNTVVDIIDNDDDEDSDDTYTDVALNRGDSYIVYMRDGAVNDDARGKWDGDYFTVTSNLPVTVQMSTNSDWQHDWAPSESKSMIGETFFLFSPPTSFSDRDINVFAYHDDTEVNITDITTNRVLTTGKAVADIPNGKRVLSAALSEGEDLIVRNNLGIDMLDPGRTYLVQATRPVTVQYGALFDKTRNSARDGGGFVPASSGSSAGEKFYFFVPHNPNKLSEVEIRMVSYSDANDITLEGWDTETETWNTAGTWTLDELEHADYVGGSYDLFRLTGSAGKFVSVFEANWLETGAAGTSDVASFVSSRSGSGAGKEFIAYLGPPGKQSNVTTQKGTYSHLFIFTEESNVSVTVKDADTNGSIINETYTANPDGYVNVKVDQATWNQLNNIASGTRPYLHITSDKNISVLSTNWNDNWMTYTTSVLEPSPVISIHSSSGEGPIDELVTHNIAIGNPIQSSLSSPQTETEIIIPDGMLYLSTSGDLGTPTVTETNGVTSLKFDGYSLAAGAVLYQSLNVKTKTFYNNGDRIVSGDLLTINVRSTGLRNGQLYVTNNSVNTEVLDGTRTRIGSFSALKRLDTAIISWSTEYENSNQGFNVYQSTKPDGRFKKVNPSLILSKGDANPGHTYSLTSKRLHPRKDYYYKIEMIDTAGRKIVQGPISTKDSSNASLALILPNTKRVMIADEKMIITWASLGLDGTNVKLEYSTDDFQNDVNTIVASTLNDGEYRWTIPNTPTTTLKVRIKSLVDTSVMDTSDEYSSIREPEYSTPDTEVYATTLEPIDVGDTKYFPFGVANYTDDSCVYTLTPSVDVSGWTLEMFEDVNSNNILDADEMATSVTQSTAIAKDDDEFRFIVKATLNPTLTDENPTVDSWDYKLSVTGTCQTDTTRTDTGFYHKYEAEALGSHGNIIDDPDASGLQSVVGLTPNVLHHLVFGGYYTEYVGNNKFQAVVFRSKTNDNDFVVPMGELDIIDYHSQHVVNEFVFPSNQFFANNVYQGIYLYMISPLSGVLEPRVDFYGIADMWVDTVEIRSLRKGSNITYEAEFMEKFTGVVENDPDSSGGQHISTVPGEVGHIAFGPYTTLPNDEEVFYEADFWLKVDDISSTDKVGRIEINNYLGDGLIAQADIHASQFFEADEWQKFSLSWKGRPLDTANSGFNGSSMEYRVYTYGHESIKLSLDRIVQHRRANQNSVYEAEQYYRSVGAIVADENASNLAAAETDEDGYLLFGPDTTDQIGATTTLYQALFTMSVEDNSIIRPAGFIDVFNVASSFEERLGGYTIYPSQFQESGKYQTFVVQFVGPPEGSLQFRVKSHGVTNLRVDKVEVRPVADSDEAIEVEDNEKFKYEDTDLFSSVGTFNYDGTAYDQLVVRGTSQGYLAFGPYTAESIGEEISHQARFTLKSSSNTRTAPVARIEVHHVESDQILEEKILNGNQFIAPNQFQHFYLNFVPPLTGTLQYRVYLFGTGETISLDQVKVFESVTDDTEPLPDIFGNLRRFSYNAIDLQYYDSAVIYDERSTSGRVLRMGTGNPGYLMYGPYTLDGIGTGKSYQAKFALATDDNSSEDFVARIEVYSYGNVLSSVDIKGSQFNTTDEYQEFPVNFASPLDGRLEYRIFSTGDVTLSADYVDVYEITTDISASNVYDVRYEAETELSTRVGKNRYDLIASDGQAKSSNKEGHLAFGPYTVDLSATDKTYLATYYLRTEDTSGDVVVADLDVMVDGEVMYRRLVFANEFARDDSYYGFTIPFMSPEDTSSEIQFRAYVFGDRAMYIDRVDVVDIGNSTSTTHTQGKQFEYEAEEMTLASSTLHVDPAASGGFAVRSSGEGFVTAGFSTTEGIGIEDAYEARFFMKVSDNSSNVQAATAQVYSSEDGVLTEKVIFPAEFSANGAYQYFPLIFSTPATGTLEYRVISHDNTQFIFDKVEIHSFIDTSTVGAGDFNYEAEHLPRAAGQEVRDTDAENGQAAKATVGQVGHITFGPYTTDGVGTGKTYKAKFFLKVSDNTETGDVVHVDVANGFTVLSKLVLSGTNFTHSDRYQVFTTTFDAPASGDLQYRVFAEGRVDVSVDRIEVHEVDSSESNDTGDQLWRYEANEFQLFRGNVVYDTSANADQAVQTLPNQTGTVSFGPYTTQGVGTGLDYEARFYLKIDDNAATDHPVVRIDAYSTGDVLEQVIVFPTQFSANDTYQVFTVPFTSPPTGTIEYRMYSYGTNEVVTLDRVDIYPSSGTSVANGVDYAYEAENLFQSVGSAIYELGASNNRSVRGLQGEVGHITFGPYTTDTVGSDKEYKARFYLKTSDNSSTNDVVEIDVVNGFNILGKQRIRGTDFSQENAYETFTVLFDAPSSGDIQYRVHVKGNATIHADKIEVIEVTGQDATEGDYLWQYNATDLGVFFGDVIFDADAIGFQAVRARTGVGEGVVTFGPYTTQGVDTSEAYEARFYIKPDTITSSANPILKVDVYNNGTVRKEELVYPQDFSSTSTYQAIILPFTSPPTGTLEYRMYSYGDTEAILDRVEIYPQSVETSTSSADFTYEAEHLFQIIGSKVFESGASNSRSVQSFVGDAGHLTFGPYTAEGVGTSANYEAVFHLKVDDNTSSSDVIFIDVAGDSGGLGFQFIKGTDFTSTGDYQTFTIPFSSPPSGTLQYRVYSYGVAGVQVDKIDVNQI